MPDVVKKQTIKQAKASFKARGRPTLSEREARQLERSIELEQRAERAKEAEKRRLIAAGKRTEKEKRELALKQQQVQLGTQRRCDRFGYKSSQFHLGAFFGKKPANATTSPLEKMHEETNDGFGDDDLDDESLLDACDGPAPVQVSVPAVHASESAASKTHAALDAQEDFDMDDESLLDACEAPALAGSKALEQKLTSMPRSRNETGETVAEPATSYQKPTAQSDLATQEDFGSLDDFDYGTPITKALEAKMLAELSSNYAGKPVQQIKSAPKPMAPPPLPNGTGTKVARGSAQSTKTSTIPRALEDLTDFFDNLDSGTQIARDLNNGLREVRRASNASGSSFGSGSLDLTEEDMEMMMDPSSQSRFVSASPSLATTASWPKSAERGVTPTVPRRTVCEATPAAASIKPPITMAKQASLPKTPSVSHASMLPPALPVTRPQAKLSTRTSSTSGSRAIGTNPRAVGTNPRATSHNPRATGLVKQQVPAAIRGPFLSASSLYCSPDLGFTSTQLESFIDDDLQLTQIG